MRSELATSIDADNSTGAGKWNSYKIITSVARRFRGYELPENYESERKRLSDDPKVKEELTAQKELKAASLLLSRSRTLKRGVAALKKVVQDRPTQMPASRPRICSNGE